MFVLSLVLGAAAVLGVGYVRLSHGPVSFNFLARTIERGITAELNGLEARLDDAQIALARSGWLELRLTQLRLVEPGGDVVATVPEAAIELSREALWSLQLVPSRIDLIEPRLYLAYKQDGGLSLRLDQSAPNPAGAGTTRPAAAAAPLAQRRSGAALLKEANGRARQQQASSAYLRQIGVRDAIVSIETESGRGELRVVTGGIDLDPQAPHQLATLDATMASDEGPWRLGLICDEPDETRAITVHIAATGFSPRGLAGTVPQLRPFKFVDVPANLQAMASISEDGHITAGSIKLTLDRGRIITPPTSDGPVVIERGEINLSYDGSTREFALQPASIEWAGSRVAFGGRARFEQSTDEASAWLFDIATSEGRLAGEGPKRPGLALERGTLRGRIVPATGEVRIDDVSVKVGAAEFHGKGSVDTGGALGDGGVRFEGQMAGGGPAEVLAVWSRAFAGPARTWIAQHVKKGTLKNGVLKFYSGSLARDVGAMATTSGPVRLTLAAEIVDGQAVPLAWLPPVDAPRVLVQIENRSLEITVPDASLSVSPTQRIPLKAGRMASDTLDSPVTTSEITFRGLAPLVPVLNVLEMSPLHVLKQAGISSTDGMDGKVDAQVKLAVPLIRDLAAKDVKIEAKAKVSDGRAKQLAGAYDVQGGQIAIDVTDAMVEAKGDLLVAGVPVKLGWQRILDTSGEKQPPLRLSAVLDTNDRNQLGIDINQLVQGEIPVDVLIEKGAQDETSVKVRADLTNTDIGLESIAWRKPPGHAASFQADIVKGKTTKYELQNLRIAGDDLTVEGTATIGNDNKIKEINFSDVQLNVITRLSIQAALKTEAGAERAPLWIVKVRGANFDGRDLYRSLMTFSGSDKSPSKPGKPPAGMDIDAEIGNVLGHSDVYLRGVHIKMSRRADKITALDLRGTLDGGAPIAVTMASKPGEPRRLLADTTDAGQAIKMIGVYPNLQGGRGRLDVNVDGAGNADKYGTLWVESFNILGDPVVAEVLSSSPALSQDPGPQPQIRPKKGQVVREVIEFERMKVPFAVGCGQLVIADAYMRGPLVGVNLVGKADFKQRLVNVGGTYVPLQGLNNLFGDVPLLGDVASGPQKNGLFGITFAVQGPMAQPQVYVNPLSMVAPGIFREMFQMTNPNPKVSACDNRAPLQPVESRVRASSQAPSAGTERARTGAVAPPVTADGWSSQVAPSRVPR